MKTLLSSTLIAVACTSLAQAADNEKHAGHKRSPMAAAIAEKSGAEFEAAYLGMMTLHHQRGQPMWALARERSKNDTILGLEKKTAPKEKKEIEQMTAWLKQWHNKTPQDFQVPAESKKMMAKDMEELKEATGEQFDSLFARKMARHHMGAIEMGELAEEKAQHDEVKASGAEIAKSQREDRKKLLQIAKAAR